MIKRLLSILVALVLIVTALAACGTSSLSDQGTAASTAAPAATSAATTAATTADANAVPAETAKLKWVFYGDESNRMKDFVQNELKDRLKKDLNIELEVQYLSWNDFGGGKSDLMLASGEDFASYDASLPSHVAKGYYADVTDALAKYGDGIKKVIDPNAWDGVTIKGRMYGIPMGNKPNASEYYSIMVRQDLLEEVGMTEIKTIDELEKACALVKAKHPDYYLDCDASKLEKYLNAAYSKMSISSLDTFIAHNFGAAVVDESTKDDKVISWFESPEFKSVCQIAQRWVASGIIPKESITNQTQIDAAWGAGKGFFAAGSASRPMDLLPAMQKAVPTAKLKNYFINDDGRPKVNQWFQGICTFVSAASKNVDRYVQFLSYIETNADNFNFLVYGVQGKDYDLDGGKIVPKSTDALFDEWAFANIPAGLKLYPKSASDDAINAYKHWNDGSIASKAAGFLMNMEPVKTEQAQLSAIINEYGTPMMMGFLPYDKNYDTFIKKLKAAGLDKYVAEYQKQFTAYKATKK